ncbi:uncharacterized protein K02A2.6-like [Strongylocentrotus purpuratus]|uniref:Integrase catalytic domain-containing protein n=1 Tax=Strongylocentrotus purpuratus TaxID=7668 RepID=A0A7M7T0S5_STRPU|nr:uncharacterized protein K02A2.6-like [Strongylocentrotus purpuratus]
MSSATSSATIDRLRQTFAIHGLPHVVVSDKGSSFTSLEFQDFMSQNGIKHVKSSPYHPATNGLAERAVQTVKSGLKKVTGGKLETRLAHFLLAYRTTEHSTTGMPPAAMFMNRHLRTRLDTVYPDVKKKVDEKLRNPAALNLGPRTYREFQTGELVFALNFGIGNTWMPGTVTEKRGPVSYEIELEDREWRRHVDYLRNRYQKKDESSASPSNSDDEFLFPEEGEANDRQDHQHRDDHQDREHFDDDHNHRDRNEHQDRDQQPERSKHPQREGRRPPDYYGFP